MLIPGGTGVIMSDPWCVAVSAPYGQFTTYIDQVGAIFLCHQGSLHGVQDPEGRY